MIQIFFSVKRRELQVTYKNDLLKAMAFLPEAAASKIAYLYDINPILCFGERYALDNQFVH
jgi:hypothetical protein